MINFYDFNFIVINRLHGSKRFAFRVLSLMLVFMLFLNIFPIALSEDDVEVVSGFEDEVVEVTDIDLGEIVDSVPDAVPDVVLSEDVDVDVGSISNDVDVNGLDVIDQEILHFEYKYVVDNTDDILFSRILSDCSIGISLTDIVDFHFDKIGSEKLSIVSIDNVKDDFYIRVLDSFDECHLMFVAFGNTYDILLIDKISPNLFSVVDEVSDSNFVENYVSEDISEDVSEDLSEGISDGVSEDVSEDLSEDISEDVSEDLSEDISDGVSEDVSEDLSEDISDDASEDLSEDISDDASEDLSENISDGISEDVLEDLSEDISDDASEDLSEDISDGVSEDVSEDLSEDISDGVSADVSEDLSEDISDGVSEDVSGDFSENVYDDDLKDVSEDLPEDTSDGVSEDVSEDLSEDVFDGVSEDASEDLSEDAFDDVSEDVLSDALSYPAQIFDGVIDSIVVHVDAPEGAFPDGTTMVLTSVLDESLMNNVKDVVEEGFVEVRGLVAVDITFFDVDGNVIEPLVPISVNMMSDSVVSDDAMVVHVSDDGDIDVIDSVAYVDDSVSLDFESDSFSTYVFVMTDSISTKYIPAVGDESYSISVSYGENANIPNGSVLSVSEILDIDSYVADTETLLNEDEHVGFSRFFDIKIVHDGEIVHPDAPVNVSIVLNDDVDSQDINVVHFGDEVDDLPVVVNDDTLVVQTDGFSVFGFYTVDFYYDGFIYRLTGGSSILLSELFEYLNIDVSVVDSHATFSDSSLLLLEPVIQDDTVVDWLLTSLASFDSHEILSVDIGDGEVITINVTDIQVEFTDEKLVLKCFDGATSMGDYNYVWTPGSIESGHSYSFRLNYKFNTSSDVLYWVPGEIEIKLPLHLFKGRSGDLSDENDIYYDKFDTSLAKAGSDGLTSSNVFVYEIDDNGTESEDDDVVIVRNRLNVSPTKENFFEFSYTLTHDTYDYVDESVLGSFFANLIIYDQNDVDGLTVVDRSNTIANYDSNSVSVGIDTMAVVSPTFNAIKDPERRYDDWHDTWMNCDEPRDIDDTTDYAYVVWRVVSEINATQPFDFVLSDVLDASVVGGEVVGYKMQGDSYYVPASEVDAGKVFGVVPSSGTVRRTDYVLTRFDKTYYDGDGTVDNPGVFVDGVDNYVILNSAVVTVIPVDNKDPETFQNVNGVYVEKKRTYSVPSTTFNANKTGTSVDYTLSRFMDDEDYDVDNLNYNLSLSSVSWLWTYLFDGDDVADDDALSYENAVYYGRKPVCFEIVDDSFDLRYFDYQAYLSRGYIRDDNLTNDLVRSFTKTWQGGTGSDLMLTSDDYSITALAFSYAFRDAVLNENTTSFDVKSLTNAEIIACTNQSSGVDGKSRLGSLYFDLYSDGDFLGTVVFDFASRSISVEPNLGANVLISDSDFSLNDGSLRIEINPDLNVTGYVFYNENSLYSSDFSVKPTVRLKHGSVVMSLIDGITNDDSSVVHPDYIEIDLENKNAQFRIVDPDSDSVYYMTNRSASDSIIGDTRSSEIKKYSGFRKNDSLSSSYLIDWHVDFNEVFTQSGESVNVSQHGGTFYDYLPYGAHYVPDSLIVYADGVVLDSSQYRLFLSTTEDGRDEMRVFVLKVGGAYSLFYQTSTSWISVLEQRTGDNETLMAHNAVVYQTGNDSLADANLMGESWSSGVNNRVAEDYDWVRSIWYDYDSSSWSNSNRCIATSFEVPVNALVSGEMGLHKLVRSLHDNSSWSNTAVVNTGEEYAYRLSFGSEEGRKAYDMIIYDLLEAESDLSEWHGVLKSVDVSSVRRLGGNPVVYYSSLPRDVLTDLVQMSSISDSNDSIDFMANLRIPDAVYDGSPIWTTVKPDVVTAVAVDMRRDVNGNPFVISGGNTISIVLNMVAPDDLPSGMIENVAYNGVYLDSRHVMESKDLDDDSTLVVDHLRQSFTRVYLHADGEFSFYKTSSENEDVRIEDVVFSLTGMSAYGNFVNRRATSDENGHVLFSRLEMTGDRPYVLREVRGISDYHLDLGEIYVWVMENGKVFITGVDTLPDDFSEDNFEDYLPSNVRYREVLDYVMDDSGNMVPVVVFSYYLVTNQPRVHGNLSFVKFGTLDGESKHPVYNAFFALSSKTGFTDYGNSFETKYASSDEHGVVFFEDIEMGKYVLEEITPADGCVLANRKFDVIVDSNGVVSLSLDDDGLVHASDNVYISDMFDSDNNIYTIVDEDLHSFMLQKVDSMDGVSLSGAEFNLYGVSDYGTMVDKRVVSVGGGEVVFDGLEPGTYYLRETVAPSRTIDDGSDGYVLSYAVSDVVYTVVIDRYDNVVISYDNGEDVVSVAQIDDGVSEHKPSEFYYDFANGMFVVPNDRLQNGRLTIVKKWQQLETDGSVTVLTDTSNNPIPSVHIDATVPVVGNQPAKIDRSKWDSVVNRIGKSNVRSVLKYNNVINDFSDWSLVSVENDGLFGGKIYLKNSLDNGTLYWWADQSSGYLYFPENCANMFRGDNGNYVNLTSFDMSDFSTHFTTTVAYMFYATGVPSVTFNRFDTSYLNDFSYMFADSTHVENVALSNPFKVNYLGAPNRTMLRMFGWPARTSGYGTLYGSKLTSVTLENINSQGVISMQQMFAFCDKLTAVNGINTLDTSSVTTFYQFMQDARAIRMLDISGWDTSSVRNVHSMFTRAGVDTDFVNPVRNKREFRIYVGPGWTMSGVVGGYGVSGVDEAMFKGCSTLVGQNGTPYLSNYSSRILARYSDVPYVSGQELTYGYLWYKEGSSIYETPVVDDVYIGPSATVSSESELNMETLDLKHVSADDDVLADIFDEWIYVDDPDSEYYGCWLYNMAVANVDMDYYVYEEQSSSGLMSKWTWIDSGSGGYTILPFVHDTDGSVLITNQKTVFSHDDPGGDPRYGDLLISKTVRSSLATGNELFAIDVAFDSDVTLSDGTVGRSETIYLKANESVYYTDIVAGTRYSVEEVLTDAQSLRYVSSGDVPRDRVDVIVADELSIVNIVNTDVTNSLKLSKVAVDNTDDDSLDVDQIYSFIVDFWTETEVDDVITRHPVSGITGTVFNDVVVDNGVISRGQISLKSGYNVVFNKIPMDVKYSITEAICDGFEVNVDVDGRLEHFGVGNQVFVSGSLMSFDVVDVEFENVKVVSDEIVGFTLTKVLGDGSIGDDRFGFSIVLSGLLPSKTYSYRQIDSDGEAVLKTFVSSSEGGWSSVVYLSNGESLDFSHGVSRFPSSLNYQISEINSGDYIASYKIVKSDGSEVIHANLLTNLPLMTPHEQVVSVNDSFDDAVVFTNTEPLHPVVIRKVDSVDNLVADASLSIYRVYVDDVGVDFDFGLVTETGSLSNSALMSTVTDDENVWAFALRQGSYLLRETECPVGYKQATDIRFDVDSGGNVAWFDTHVMSDSTWSYSFVDVRSGNIIDMIDSPYVVRVIKQGPNGLPVLGARLGVYDRNGTLIPNGEWASDVSGAHVISGGIALWTESNRAVYTLRENHVPAGYSKADDIVFRLVETDSDPWYKLQVMNSSGSFDDIDDLTIVMVDGTEFMFYKQWRNSNLNENVLWPEDKNITFDIRRGYIPVNDTTYERDGTSVSGMGIIATFVVDYDKATSGVPFDKVSGDSLVGQMCCLEVGSGHSVRYRFLLDDLPKYGLEIVDGIERTVEYIYYVSEVDPHFEGYYQPLHLNTDSLTIVGNNSYTVHGGVISNETLLVSPTGVHHDDGQFALMFICLVCILLVLFLARRRRDRRAGGDSI